MIHQEKIRLMTNVALLAREGSRGKEAISRYKRRDYIILHIFIICFFTTIADLMLTGAVLIQYAAADPKHYVSFDMMCMWVALWVIVYLIVCSAMGIIAYLCYGRRYEEARRWKKRYRAALLALEEYYESTDGQIKKQGRKAEEL